MRIENLYGKVKGSPAFVVGTGPSMQCVQLSVFRGAYIVGLNQAWKYSRQQGVPFQLMLTAHPELFQEYAKTVGWPVLGGPQWVIKKKPPMADLELDDSNHYVYLTSPELKTVEARPADTLYLGEGIQCTAIDLLARMGANPIILLGVDMNVIDGDFHGHDQHVRWLGQTPDEQYALYRKTVARVRSAVRDKFGVQVLALSPFLGTDAAREDYVRLKKELKLLPLPKPKDVSPYRRK